MSFIGLQENYNRIRILMQMAKSDEQVNLAELTYIVWLSQKLGVSKSELDELAQENGNFSAPISLEERKTMLYDVIKLIYVDGQVAEAELAELETLAKKLDLDDDAIASLVTSIKENPDQWMDKASFDRLFS
jgi:uncharacterized tellurite resistance protein B-like protein